MQCQLEVDLFTKKLLNYSRSSLPATSDPCTLLRKKITLSSLSQSSIMPPNSTDRWPLRLLSCKLNKTNPFHFRYAMYSSPLTTQQVLSWISSSLLSGGSMKVQRVIHVDSLCWKRKIINSLYFLDILARAVQNVVNIQCCKVLLTHIQLISY